MARRLRNITITLDPDTAAKVRVRAAENNLSVSRYIGQVMREHEGGQASAYEEAMRRYFANQFEFRSKPGERYPTREETHERTGLRRR